jgi:hypothetical protein
MQAIAEDGLTLKKLHQPESNLSALNDILNY